jgi:hypothetical protein
VKFPLLLPAKPAQQPEGELPAGLPVKLAMERAAFHGTAGPGMRPERKRDQFAGAPGAVVIYWRP